MEKPPRFLLDLVETRIVLTFGSPTVKEKHIFLATLVRLAVCLVFIKDNKKNKFKATRPLKVASATLAS